MHILFCFRCCPLFDDFLDFLIRLFAPFGPRLDVRYAPVADTAASVDEWFGKVWTLSQARGDVFAAQAQVVGNALSVHAWCGGYVRVLVHFLRPYLFWLYSQVKCGGTPALRYVFRRARPPRQRSCGPGCAAAARH